MVTNGSQKMQTWSGEFLLYLDPVCVNVFVAWHFCVLPQAFKEKLYLLHFPIYVSD